MSWPTYLPERKRKKMLSPAILSQLMQQLQSQDSPVMGDENMTIEDLIALSQLLNVVDGGEPVDEIPEESVTVIQSDAESPGDVGDMMQAVMGSLTEDEPVLGNDPLDLARQAVAEAQRDSYGNKIPADALDVSPLGTAALAHESRPMPLSTPATLLK